MPVNSLERLVFIEDHAQALWVYKNIESNAQTKLIALTAVAMLALDEKSLSYTPISDVADTRALASVERRSSVDVINLLRDIEGWILTKYESAAQIGEGFLTGLAYYLQLAVGGIATRAFLMSEAIRVFSPSSILIFQGEVNAWFAGDGYECDPWVEFVLEKSKNEGVDVQLVQLPGNHGKEVHDSRRFHKRLRSFAYASVKKIHRFLTGSRLKKNNPDGSFRLLFAGASHYDWGPVLDQLRENQNFYPIFMKSAYVPGRGWWAHYYQDSVLQGFDSKEISLNCAPIDMDENERKVLSDLLDEWIDTHPAQLELKVLGMNLFAALLPHLRSMLVLAVPLARYSLDVAVRILELTRPHAVCFDSITWLSSIVLAAQARKQQIPVIAYQHGGSYGVQDVPTHDFAEFAHADYMLSYGTGTVPPKNPVVDTRADFIPVGSALIESSMKKVRRSRKKSSVLNVLWIGEVSESNMVGGPWLVEDTTRYLLEKRSLEALNTEGIQTTYRPFPYNGDALAIPEWLEQAGLTSIRLDTNRSLAKSLHESDLVICDSSSSTTWFETIAFGIPLIVYCDPQQTHLTDQFANDLERACHWCKSVAELLNSLERLVREKQVFVNELSRLSTGEFTRKYILNERESVNHVLSFLSAICSERIDCD